MPASPVRRAARRWLGTAVALLGLAGLGITQAGAAAAAPAGDVLPRTRPVLHSTVRLPPLPLVRATSGSTTAFFLGDSVAQGWNASSPVTTFPQVAARMLAADGPVDRRVVAVPGATAASLGGAVTVPAGAGLVVLELGTNDAPAATSLPVFDRAYEALTRKVRAAAPRAALVCLGTWQPDSAALDGLIRQACGGARGTYVPLVDLFLRPELHGVVPSPHFVGFNDTWHPNDAGYAVIAQRVVDAVRGPAPLPAGP